MHYFEPWPLDFRACTITHLYICISVYFINILFLRNKFRGNDMIIIIYIGIKRSVKKTRV